MNPSIVLAGLLVPLTALHAADVDVYLFGGQSNMQGLGKVAELPADTPKELPNVRFWNGRDFETFAIGKTRSSTRAGEFGPEVGFALEFARAGRAVCLIKHAASGMPLHHGWNGNTWAGGPPQPGRRSFYPGESRDDPNQGICYRAMLAQFAAGLRKIKEQGDTPRVRGFLWMQGEQDSKHAESATNYAASLRHLRERVICDVGADPNLPMAFGQVLPHEPALEKFTHRVEIRGQMAAADGNSGRPEAIPHVRMVSTDGLAVLPDTVHYTTDGQLRLGKMLAERMLAPAAPVRSAVASPAGGKPNVVIILSDDVGYGDLSCYGATRVSTPNLDRLAAQGRRFTHAYAPGSVCTPTRYALVTGRYCWRTHLQKGVAGATEPLMIETNRMTIGSLAKAHGYRTAAIGKWHLGYGAPPQTDWNAPLVPGPLEVGFDVHFAVPNNHNDSIRAYIEGREMVGRAAGVPFRMGKGLAMPEGLAQPRVDDLVEAALAERAVRFIDENHASPFLLYFTPVVAHTHITPAAKYRGTSRAGLYGDYLQQLDAEVGDLLATLDRHGIADRTLVLFSSDNGGALNDFKNAGENLNLADEAGDVRAKCGTAKRDARAAGHLTNGSLREGKGSPYEGGHRVPFIVRWPGRVPAGTTCGETVCLVDMLATLARILGTELPAGAGEDSFDMLPALCGEPLKAPIHPTLVLHSGGGVYSVRSGPWKFVETPEGRKAKPDALYDLGVDPGETNNVAAKNPDVVQRLAAALEQARRDGRTRP